MPSRRILDLREDLRRLACQFISTANADSLIKDAGGEVFLSCTYRSGDEQNLEHAKGRTSKGVPCLCLRRMNPIGKCKRHPLGLTVTNAKAGESPHNCVDKSGKPASRAFDFAIRLPDGGCDWNATDALWKRAIAIGRDLGLDSGAAWGDSPHMQLKNWKA